MIHGHQRSCQAGRESWQCCPDGVGFRILKNTERKVLRNSYPCFQKISESRYEAEESLSEGEGPGSQEALRRNCMEMWKRNLDCTEHPKTLKMLQPWASANKSSTQEMEPAHEKICVAGNKAKGERGRAI